ncbi:MAG: HDIG domain-containing protein [Chloroflexi bacterium]|nr:HDIG domain-containing protein [Chloroflexota bacterium]
MRIVAFLGGASIQWGRLVRSGAFLAALVAGLTLVLTFQFLPTRYNLNEGDVSVYTIKSPQKVTFVSHVRTQEERQRAALAVADVYRLLPEVAEEQRRAASDAFQQIGEIRLSSAPLEVKRDRLRKLPNLVTPLAVLDHVLDFDETSWQAVSGDVLRVLDRLMLNRITEKQLGDTLASIPAYVDPGLSDRQAAVVSQLTRSFVKTNYAVDADATARARREAMERVEPVRVTIERGETIVRDGAVVRAVDLERLEAAGLRNPAIRWTDFAGVFLLLLSMACGYVFYLYRLHPTVVDHPSRLLLLALLLILTVLAAKVLVWGRDVNTVYAYAFPTAATSMVIAVLLGTEVAVGSTLLLAVSLGLMTTSPFELTLMTLAGGLIGIVGVQRVERVSALFQASLLVAAANAAVILGFQLFVGEPDSQRLLMLALAAVGNGVLAGVVTAGSVSLLGHPLAINLFGISTTMSLLELAHPSQPVFRRLLIEAPGTYHHSVVVANLAERAAEAIGADSLLVRIGSYYHDVGKLTRPYMFIENQMDGQNIHDQLDPLTSARLIIAHVTDGLEIARQHGLPPQIRSVIVEHQGTCLVKFFYRQACRGAEQKVDEGPFRYSGPRPQSRESAIVMLADGAEATVRASGDHSPEAIAAIVERIVQDRLQDHQLDDCDLTLRDLERVKRTFVNVLQGIYHPRIEYPPPVALPEPLPTAVGEAP